MNFVRLKRDFCHKAVHSVRGSGTRSNVYNRVRVGLYSELMTEMTGRGRLSLSLRTGRHLLLMQWAAVVSQWWTVVLYPLETAWLAMQWQLVVQYLSEIVQYCQNTALLMVQCRPHAVQRCHGAVKCSTVSSQLVISSPWVPAAICWRRPGQLADNLLPGAPRVTSCGQEVASCNFRPGSCKFPTDEIMGARNFNFAP